MDKIKKLQMVAKVLRQHHGYKFNKESNFQSRFNFKLDKKNGNIRVFNDEADSNLFLWTDLVALSEAFDLSCYVTYDKYDLKRVVLQIY